MSDEERAAGAASEAVEEVDEAGRVLRVVSRAEVRARRLRHRCTYVVVVDDADRVVVHRRAGWKDVWPDRWDLAFGGVVGVGEGWDEAAARELVEEAGVRAPLVALTGVTAYADADVALVGRGYLARHDGPVACDDGEVVAIERVPRAEVVGWITARPHCPDSVALVGPAIAALAPPPGRPPSSGPSPAPG